METLQSLFDIILHIDTYLISFVATYGILTYIVLFMIIFCETGLVIMPFLPGDSLLFAAGSIAANASHALNIYVLFALLSIAAILGNKVNYMIGRLLGPKVFAAKKVWLLNKKHLEEAHRFYEKHGGKTIIIGRYLPIIRTFAPFIAGVGYMNLREFALFNVLSGLLWVGSLLAAGYLFGALPIIKDNFSLVVYGIIALSLIPPLVAFIYRKSSSEKLTMRN